MTEFWTTRRLRILLAIGVLLGLFFIVYNARGALLPFFFGAIIAYIILPLVNTLHRGIGRLCPFLGRYARHLAILVTYLIILLVIIVVLAFAIPAIAAQISLLGHSMPAYAAMFQQFLEEHGQEWLLQYQERIPLDIRKSLQDYLQNLTQTLFLVMQQGILRAAGVFRATISVIFATLLVPVWMFFVLRDERKIGRSVYHAVPPAYRTDVQCVQALVDHTLSSFLRGQLVLCVSVGVMAAVILSILDVDFALLLGILAGIFEIVPNLGPILGAIPAVLVALPDSLGKALAVIIAFVIIQQAENLILVPRVMGRSVRLHPAIVMMVLVVGGALWGVWGLLLAVPVTALTRDLLRYARHRLSDERVSPEQALELASGIDMSAQN